jgi:hypothetical protein
LSPAPQGHGGPAEKGEKTYANDRTRERQQFMRVEKGGAAIDIETLAIDIETLNRTCDARADG